MRQRWLASVWQDARNALRTLRRRPWRFLAVSGLFAVGVGITTAMFTVVDALVLRPVPFPDPGRLARVDLGGFPQITMDVIKAWRSSRVFANVEAVVDDYGRVGTDGRDVKRRVARVTPGLFDLLGGVRPVRGRMFGPMDIGRADVEPVLISEDLWRTLYGSDPGIIGRTLTIDRASTVVVGVLPAQLRFPSWNTEVWRAASFDKPADRFSVYVRFLPDVPQSDALVTATRVAKATATYSPTAMARAWNLVDEELDDFYARAVPLLAGGVVLLFIALCANVSSLTIAGLAARSRELGTRAALGASRVRLIRQALIEGSLTALAGAVAGVVFAWFLVSAARGMLSEAALARSLHPIDLNLRALGVTAIAGVIAVIGAGVLPAVLATRIDSSRLLQLGGGGTETKRVRLATRGLLVLQVTLTCTLLIGGTVLVRSFLKLVNEDRGLDVSNILIADFHFPAAPKDQPRAFDASAQAMADAVRALPSVSSVSWTYGTPPGAATEGTKAFLTDLPGASPVQQYVYVHRVDADFFALYRLPILRGRGFESSDDPSATVISERLASLLFPGTDPVGHRITVDRQDLRVVGVARELHYISLQPNRDAPQLYFRLANIPTYRGMLSIRCETGCPGPMEVWRRLQEGSAAVTVYDVYPLERTYFRELARPRAAAAVAFVFSALALVTAATGLFSLLSRTVARRLREFGIRTALGATPSRLRTIVWREAFAVTIAGLLIGILASVPLTRAISSLLYDVTMTDPLNFMTVVGVVFAVAALASWRPTRTAVRASPAVLLREE